MIGWGRPSLGQVINKLAPVRPFFRGIEGGSCQKLKLPAHVLSLDVPLREYCKIYSIERFSIAFILHKISVQRADNMINLLSCVDILP